MSLLGRVGILSEESAILEGEPDEVERKRRAALDQRVTPKRIEVARSTSTWFELEAADLVARDRGRVYVSAKTDFVFEPMNGLVFEPDTARPLVDPDIELYYVVQPDNTLRFFQRRPGTWSQIVQRRTEKQLQRTAPRPTPEWQKP